MSAADEPKAPGWYVTAEGVNNYMVYARNQFGEWRAITIDGSVTPCLWSYIDQAGPVRMIAPYGDPGLPSTDA